jgi:hypothetical protein
MFNFNIIIIMFNRRRYSAETRGGGHDAERKSVVQTKLYTRLRMMQISVIALKCQSC